MTRRPHTWTSAAPSGESARARRGAGSDTGERAETAQLHRNSFVPLYFQLAEVLKERIEAGEWPAGARFLSERELCEEFGVSRTVVRPALTMLEGDGQLVRLKGRGTFVAPAKVIDRIRGLSRTLSHPIPKGTRLRFLAAVEQKPESHVARILELARRDRIAHITSVTSVAGRPLFLCDSFIAKSRVPTILSVAEAGSTLGPTTGPPVPLELSASRVSIQTSYCSEFEGEQLEIGAGGLVLLIRCIEYARHSGAERPVEVARIVYPADGVELAGLLL